MGDKGQRVCGNITMNFPRLSYVCCLLCLLFASNVLEAKNSPGDILSGTQDVAVSNALDTVLKSAPWGTKRSVAIGTAFSAGVGGVEPEVWLNSGDEQGQMPADVPVGSTALNLF